MKHTTALAALLMLAATAAPFTVADTSDVTPCPVLARLDAFAVTGRTTPLPDVNVATSADPQDACAAIMGLRDAATCDGGSPVCDPACLVDMGRDGAGPPSFGDGTMPRGHADFNVAAVITTPCIDPATPFVGGGATTGTLTDPLTIDITGVCVRQGGLLWEAQVNWNADIGDASYTGNFPYLSSLAVMTIDFDLEEAGIGGNKAGTSLTGEGCEFVKLGLMAEAYGEAIAWANSQLGDKEVELHGSLGFLDSPNGPIVEVAGPGKGAINIGYTLSRDVTTVGSVQWDFSALWNGAPTCAGAICAQGTVKSIGRSDELVQLPLPILG